MLASEQKKKQTQSSVYAVTVEKVTWFKRFQIWRGEEIGEF